MSEIKSNKFWGSVGKLSALVFLIGGVITLWSYFFPHAERIEVTGSYREYRLPPNLVSMLDAMRDKHVSYRIRDYLLMEKKESKIDLTENQISDISSSIENMIMPLWDDAFKYDTQKYEELIYLTVKNIGSKTAQDITLDVPVKGVALVIQQDDSRKVMKFNKKIELEDIRPKNRLKIAIWSKNNIGAGDEDEFNLTHANGVGKFDFGKNVFGYEKLFINYWPYLILLFMWLFGTLFVFYIFKQDTKSSCKADECQQDESDEKLVLEEEVED